MKNLLFGAVMFMGAFAFANSISENNIHDVKQETIWMEEVGDCVVTVYGVDRFGIGNRTGTQHTFVFADVESQEECDRLARNLKRILST